MATDATLAAAPDRAASPAEANGRTPIRTRPKSSGKKTSRFPKSSPIAKGNINGASAIAVRPTTRGEMAANPAPPRAAILAASVRATNPSPATAATVQPTNTTGDGIDAKTAIAWATTGGYE